MRKDFYHFEELQKHSRAVAKDVGVALQTWEAAKPLLREGPFNDWLESNPRYHSLLSIARGGSVSASMALARIWDETKKARVRIRSFPASLRRDEAFNEIARKSTLSKSDLHSCISKIENLVAETEEFGEAVKALRSWRHDKLAHRNPDRAPPETSERRSFGHADFDGILERSIDLVECLAIMLPDAFCACPRLAQPRLERDEWRKRSCRLWARFECDWVAAPSDLERFLDAAIPPSGSPLKSSSTPPSYAAMGSLYDADILLWSEQQADLLRRLARGERVNDAVDWENVIEEVGDVGRSEFNSVASLLEVGLTHLLLAHASPRPERVGHRQAEAIAALAGAARRYAPSMGPRLDLDEIWTVATAVARNKLAAYGGPADPLPEDCPFAVEDLVKRPPDLDALLARLAGAGGPPAAAR